MEEDVLSFKLAYHSNEIVVQRLYIIVFLAVKNEPRTALRMNEQSIVAHLALGEELAGARNHIVKASVLIPPGLLIVECRRIIALAKSAQGIALKMLAKQGYSANHLPLVKPLELIVTDVVSATGKGLRKHLLDAELLCNGRYLKRSKAILDALSEPVHTRHIEIFISRHDRAVAKRL